MRNNDLRLLQEAYSDIIYNQNILLSEGFFQDLGARLRAKFKSLAPYILTGLAGTAATGPIVVPPAVNLYRKSASNSSIAQRQVSQQDEKKYGDTFRDEHSAHNFMLKTDKFEITPRQFFASLYGDKWNDILMNARKNQQNIKNVNFSMSLDDNYLDQNYTIKIINGNEDPYMKSKPGVGGYCDGMGTIVIAKDRLESLGGFLNVLSHEIRHATQPYNPDGASPGSMYVNDYVGNAHETGVRIAELIKQYWEDHGKNMRAIPSSPEEVKNMLKYYGIYENEVQEVESTKNLPADVYQIFDMLKTMQRKPHIYKKYYNALCEQIPGLVQQTVRDYRNHV